MSILNSPFLLGFDEFERVLTRVAKSSGDGFPPYNIERLATDDESRDTLRITLAVAGFTCDQLEITVEDRQLTIKGLQTDEPKRVYLHQGIAARQFIRTFVLADGIEVKSADLQDGMLSIDLLKLEQKTNLRQIDIGTTK